MFVIQRFHSFHVYQLRKNILFPKLGCVVVLFCWDYIIIHYMSTQTFPQIIQGQNQPRWYCANSDFEAGEFKANGPRLCCVPVNPWLLCAMGKGLCCIASWWSFVSCGEIAAEEDCESEREGRERNGGNGKTQEEGKTEQKHHSQYRHIHRENPPKENSHSTQYCPSSQKVLHGSLVSGNKCVFGLVYVGYPKGIPPKCRLHLLVMISRSLQGQGKVTIHKGGSSQYAFWISIPSYHQYSWKGRFRELKTTISNDN